METRYGALDLKSGAVFETKRCALASIYIQIGIDVTAAEASIKVQAEACRDASGEGATPAPFNIWMWKISQELTCCAVVIDTAELPEGSSFLKMRLLNVDDSVQVSSTAILSSELKPAEEGSARGNAE